MIEALPSISSTPRAIAASSLPRRPGMGSPDHRGRQRDPWQAVDVICDAIDDGRPDHRRTRSGDRRRREQTGLRSN